MSPLKDADPRRMNDRACGTDALAITLGPRGRQSGLTIVELLIVVLIIGVLAGLATPLMSGYVESGRRASAAADIRMIEGAIENYRIEFRGLPVAIGTLIPPDLVDPWGAPYQYLRIKGIEGKGGLRKDKNLNPLNSDYDLYSMGPDGDSRDPLTAPVSHDDIIRANDGAYVGLASEY